MHFGKAMGILSKQNPALAEDIKIHVTSSAEKAPIMYNEVVKNGVDKNFVFEGIIKHDNLLSYYKSAAALVFPSSIETVGLPLLEAAAFGLPVLAADVDYAYEVLNGYDGVVYTDVYDYEAWAKNIVAFSINHKRYKPLPQERESDWGVFFDLIK